MSEYRDEFFTRKRPWSIYKDSVLDYYLKPYLEKVKRLGKPIAIVDMFAGRGEFLSGEPGSPVIIAKRLQPLAAAGHPVRLVCFEEHQPFASHLDRLLQPYPFAKSECADCFAKMDDIVVLAGTHTLFLYVDPSGCSQIQRSINRSRDCSRSKNLGALTATR